MDDRAPGPAEPAADTADAALRAFAENPHWDDRERDEAFERLVARHDPSELRAAARARLDDLSGADAEAVLRIVESFGQDDDRRALARAVASQPGLPPERAWEALALLEGTGLIEADPALAERWEELAETVEGDESSAELASQIEDDPANLWVALQALDAIEPAVRAEIVAGLASAPAGPALVEFLRVLAASPEPATRAAALGVLDGFDADDPAVLDAWGRIAAEHRDPEVAARARRRLAAPGPGGSAPAPPAIRVGPRLVRATVSAVDGRGRGRIGLVAEDRGEWVAAAFACDVAEGIVAAEGAIAPARGPAEEFLAAAPDGPDPDARPDLALALLGGSLLISGAGAPTALPYWLERTAGPGFAGRPIGARIEAERRDDPPPSRAARDVLDACPDWLDASPLTARLAREARLRGDEPGADSGAIRYLVERRLLDRLETLRRMLLWNAAAWGGSPAGTLARSAELLAAQLADPQFAVPGHPFLAELAARSLARAAGALDAGDAAGGRPGLPGR
jgi:hypothetical protein